MAKIRKEQVRKVKEARAAYYAAVESGDRKDAARADAVYQRAAESATSEEFNQATS